MPTKPVLRFLAWSYSRLQDYVACPLKAKLSHLMKIKEPKGPPLIRGDDIHKKAAKYIIGELKKLPDELKLYAKEFAALRKMRKRVAVEQQIAFDKNWNPCDWFDPRGGPPVAWVRVVMDAYYLDQNPGLRLVIIDYKTGKMRVDTNTDQLDLYAVAGFALRPEIDAVDAQLWYTDVGETVAKSYTRIEAAKLKAAWSKRPLKMLADTTFKPTPGAACRFCFYGQGGKAKGGPGLCRY